MGALALCLIAGLAWLVTRPWGATYTTCSSDFSSSEIQELYSRVPALLSDFEGWTMSDLEEDRRCIALGVAHDSLHAALRRKLAFRGFPEGSTYVITVVWMHEAAEHKLSMIMRSPGQGSRVKHWSPAPELRTICSITLDNSGGVAG